MFSFDHAPVQIAPGNQQPSRGDGGRRIVRVATAAVGALVLSTATVIAAVGPADAGNHARTVVASVETAAQAHG